MPRHFLALAFLLVGVSSAAVAQHDGGYAEFRNRDIKALSAQQVDDLRQGRGMGLSLPAELNGAPGPLHVLQLRDQMNVTPAQASEVERIRDEMTSAAQRLGASVIQAEAELDGAFKSGAADEASIRSMTARIGALNAELRAAHLTAHLKTRRLLTVTQLAAYNTARGYTAHESSAASPSGHRH